MRARALAGTGLVVALIWGTGVSPVAASPHPSPTAAGRPGRKAEWPESKGRPGPQGTPAPFTQSFAAQPGVSRRKPGKRPTAPVKVAPTVDGCDHNYGTRAQCIPVTFPAGVRDKCAWLADHGFRAFRVTVTDRQKLDPDRNGIACDR
ncbi:hypothetical protein [Actinoplanes sp. NPDC051851]|uniref:hypothetical protein n=1 Tax=Actinoplanes sp. NPDC051851 TaxID=3154753 RepID=UPI00342CBC3E